MGLYSIPIDGEAQRVFVNPAVLVRIVNPKILVLVNLHELGEFHHRFDYTGLRI